MGKNIMIYFDDECIELIGNIEGRGTLVNQLVKDHFSNEIESLIRKSQMINLQLEEVNNKIQKIREMKNQSEITSRKKQQLTNEELRKKEFAAKFNQLKDDGKITIDEWSDCFDTSGLNIDKAQQIMNEKM